MQPFIFHTPTKINFGEDTASAVADAIEELGGSKPLIVTDVNLVKAGVLSSMLESLANAGLSDLVIFDQVPPDSDLACVREAIKQARANKCDLVLAIGGGSVMDTAKVANIGMTFDSDVLDHEGMNTLTTRLQPLIAIPTTAGTGSEVSAVAMIKDIDEHKKLLFGSRFLFPDMAILDPKLLLSLPPKLTAATGMDALTHCIESYVSMTRNSPADGLCLEAMKLLFRDLVRATNYGGDLEARSNTLVASMMAGLSFTNAGVGIVHALAHTVGALYGTHHGLTNSVFLPYGMELNMDVAEDKFAAAYKYLCVVLADAAAPVPSWFQAGREGKSAAQGLVQAVRELTKACSLPTKLRELGVPELSQSDLENIASIALTDPAIMFNPKEASIEDLVTIIKGAY